jgi:hypothetical protein
MKEMNMNINQKLKQRRNEIMDLLMHKYPAFVSNEKDVLVCLEDSDREALKLTKEDLIQELTILKDQNYISEAKYYGSEDDYTSQELDLLRNQGIRSHSEYEILIPKYFGAIYEKYYRENPRPKERIRVYFNEKNDCLLIQSITNVTSQRRGINL